MLRRIPRRLQLLIARPVFHGYVLLPISTLFVVGTAWQLWRSALVAWHPELRGVIGMAVALWVGFCAGVVLHIPRDQL